MTRPVAHNDIYLTEETCIGLATVATFHRRNRVFDFTAVVAESVLDLPGLADRTHFMTNRI